MDVLTYLVDSSKNGGGGSGTDPKTNEPRRGGATGGGGSGCRPSSSSSTGGDGGPSTSRGGDGGGMESRDECGIYDMYRRLQQEEEARNDNAHIYDINTSDENVCEDERQERNTRNIYTMGTVQICTDSPNTLAGEPNKRMRNNDGSKQSPWKVISDHTGTRRKHYHLIYISTAKNWGHNSKLGKAIRSKEYKCSSIACIECIVEYITTGDNRTTHRNILEQGDLSLFKCVAHQLGLKNITENNYSTSNAQRRIDLHEEQGSTRRAIFERMDSDIAGPSQELYHNPQLVGDPFNDRNNGLGDQSNTIQGRKTRHHNTNTAYARQNQSFVLLLCENQAFDEGEAQKLLCSTPSGITVQFTKGFDDRLKTAVQIAKTLVFQETIEQRLERAKALALRRDPKANDFDTVYEGVMELESHLTYNDINHYNFARDTRRHFYGLTGKRNNLFFYGPPSTGKTLVMKSLIEMHYNYCILTGLQPTSPFNFSNTYMRNACFMDECKLTDNQFEQWKLLAGRQPMNTDMKYKNQHIVTNCILYTASNYEIGAYIQLNCTEAIQERTIQYNFVKKTYPYKLNPFIWEAFWAKYAHKLVVPVDNIRIDNIDCDHEGDETYL